MYCSRNMMFDIKCAVFVTFVLLQATCTICHHHRDREREAVVQTTLGKVRGSVLTSRLGNPIYSFTSIRYAEPPVGELRFQPPVPVEKWDGIYDATKPGPVCPQPNNVNSSEDCLMLNVYANKLPRAHRHVERPVIVFFHPGGFYVYTGAIYMFGPDYLLDKDIVLVTANFRLGSLGFLSTGTKEAPGNNGFKDQVVVLKWIRDNIRAFGGDPNMVILAGCSAGAVSTNLHMISPMSRGLFHRGIMMSAAQTGVATIPTNQYDLAQKQARFVNCSDESPAAIISCLKTKPAQEIADTLEQFRELGGDPVNIWRVVIEPDFGQERFIVEHPIKSMIHGRFANIPVLLGITEFEIGFVSYIGILFQSFLDLLSNDYEMAFPIIFSYERDTPESNAISTDLKRFYLGEGTVENTTRTREGIEGLYADGIIGFTVNRAVKLISATSKEDTYYYCFTYRGRYSFFYLPDSDNQTIGAVHQDDLQYIFYMSTLFPYIQKGDPEWNMVDKMIKIWSDFAYTGNPTPRKSQLLNNVKWVPYTKDSPKYLEIDNRLVIKENLYEDRYREWERLFPLSNYA